MNIKTRLSNKTFLVSFIVLALSFIYQILSLLGVTPSVTQEQTQTVVMAFINLLAMLGVVVDPTTDGIKDSDLVMNRDENKDE